MASFRLASISRRAISFPLLLVRTMAVGEKGGGVGKGGGAGGDIRSAGGAFGKMEHAHEEQYFRKLQEEQLKGMKKHLDETMGHIEKEIERHEEAIRQHREVLATHKKRMDELQEGVSSDDEKK